MPARNKTQLGAAILSGLLLTSSASAQESNLSPEARRIIGERLAPTMRYDKKLNIEEGSTIFVVSTIKVKASKLTGPPVDYEGLVTSLRGPKGIVVQQRIDEWSFERVGPNMIVSLRYVVHVEPGTKKGGNLFGRLKLLERKGFANVVFEEAFRHVVTIKPPKPSATDLSADFTGYRVYRGLADERRKKLAVRGIAGLTMEDGAALPALVRANDKIVEEVNEFDRWRRRMWVAKRHLEAASNSSDRATASLAKQYLASLDKPDSDLKDLPDIPLVAQADTPAEKPEEKGKTGATPPGGLVEVKALDVEPEKEEPREEPPKVQEPPKEVVKPETVEKPDVLDVVEELKRREEAIPSVPRALTLDDPNIAYSFDVRLGYASATVRGESATSLAWFLRGQLAATGDIGAEVTVPVVWTNLALPRTPSVLYMGNPLLALKYRLFLPAVDGRRPILTPRIRWGVPIQAQRGLPPTRLGAGEFNVEAYFVDTYAFLLEKHDLGLGFSTAWEQDLLHVSAQLYLDHFLPVGDSHDPLRVWTVSYGLSVGLRPLGDLLGFYMEGRGTMLLSGPKRSELFTYAGIRAHLFESVEPAVWLSVPLGTVTDVTTVQFGGELRFVQDVEGLIVHGSSREERTERDRFLQ